MKLIQAIARIGLLALSLLLPSCMHLGMMSHGTADHSATPESILEKEIVAGDIKATAIFPSLELGKEAQLTLRLSDARTGRALSRADVFFHAQYLHTPTDHAMHGSETMRHRADSAQVRKETDHDVNVEQEVPESPELGVYRVSFTPSQEGTHQLMFHITALDERLLEPEVTVEVTRTVTTKHDSHSGSMLGFDSRSGYAFIGAALTGAMMLVVWATGGRMF